MTLNLTKAEAQTLLDEARRAIQLEVECQREEGWAADDREFFKRNETTWRRIRSKLRVGLKKKRDK